MAKGPPFLCSQWFVAPGAGELPTRVPQAVPFAMLPLAVQGIARALRSTAAGPSGLRVLHFRAVGEILRRLTAKCLMEAVRDDARQHFAPVQLGVAIPGTSRGCSG